MWHLLAEIVVTNQTPFEWISNHMHIVGWPTLVFLAWRVGGYFKDIQTKVIKTVTQIDTMATNHFPHMQDSLQRQDIFLENIDRNIGRMADKL